jgi:pilus assembly protein CpaF
MAMMAGLDLPLAAIQEQIRRGIEIVVHQERGADGRRRIVEIVEVDPEAVGRYGLRAVSP